MRFDLSSPLDLEGGFNGRVLVARRTVLSNAVAVLPVAPGGLAAVKLGCPVVHAAVCASWTRCPRFVPPLLNSDSRARHVLGKEGNFWWCR